MGKLRVLIVDDSPIYRTQIRSALSSIANVEVVGAANNGKLALDRLALGSVDLLILDLEMPEMDGVQTLKEMKRRGFACKVLVFSSPSKAGAERTMAALRLGATEFVAKPGGESDGGQPGENPALKIRALIEPKILALFPGLANSPEGPQALSAGGFQKLSSSEWVQLSPKIVVIGSSTGGPSALETIISQLSSPLSCPVVIAQHMPPIFTAALADRLSKVSGVPAREAVNGEALAPNCIYVAPGNFHLRVHGTMDKALVALDQGPQINYVRPAVDPLFASAAAVFKEHCLAIVLTGMGMDGRDGAIAVKHHGGGVVIQDKESCAVFGMPGAVFSSGAYDRISTLEGIAEILRQKLTSSKGALKAVS